MFVGTKNDVMPVIYRLKITLIGSKPPIWRRVDVPGTILLCCLHDIFQVVMGWSDSHMHQFSKDGKRWGMASCDEFDSPGLREESEVQLSQILKREGETLLYDYDFGDDWRHKVLLEKIGAAQGDVSIAVCLGGARHCPPEDVGGVGGYQEFLKAIGETGNDEFDHILEWMDGEFDAAEFDLEGVNGLLADLRLPLEHAR